MINRPIPEGFRLGVATAAAQIEGSAAADGKGDSIWDAWCRQPGRIAEDQSPEPACDHYRRWREDVALMRDLGVQTYRFSISWPRVLPNGTGRINGPGLRFYEQLVDALLAAGIEPLPTLCHWDLPQALEDAHGGWRSAETARAFADYAGIVARRLGDRVDRWLTLNEIDNMARRGYHRGQTAPGLTLSKQIANQTTHHCLLAHGLGVAAIRAAAPRPLHVGLADDPHAFWPVWESPANRAATLAAFQASWFNRAKIIPVLTGAYPDAHLAGEEADAPVFTDAEMRAIHAPIDFLGLNTYGGTPVRARDDGGFDELPIPTYDLGQTKMRLAPLTLLSMLRCVHALAPGLPLMITENGLGQAEPTTTRGEVLDVGRKEYIRLHLDACLDAIAEGIPLTGYCVWSLLDNFEWSSGTAMRFGLVRVDYTTQRRTVKLSGRWFAEVAKARRVV
jgi:beta-glucosidase